jgi:hypothetical protein
MTEMDASLEELAHRIIRQHVLLRLFRRGPVSVATTSRVAGRPPDGFWAKIRV